MLSFKSAVQPVMGVEKCCCLFILYLAFLVLSGIFHRLMWPSLLMTWQPSNPG